MSTSALRTLCDSLVRHSPRVSKPMAVCKCINMGIENVCCACISIYCCLCNSFIDVHKFSRILLISLCCLLTDSVKLSMALFRCAEAYDAVAGV